MPRRLVAHDPHGEVVVSGAAVIIGDSEDASDDVAGRELAQAGGANRPADIAGAKRGRVILLDLPRQHGAHRNDLRVHTLVAGDHLPCRRGVRVQPAGVQEAADQREVVALQHLYVEGVHERRSVDDDHRRHGVAVGRGRARGHDVRVPVCAGDGEGHVERAVLGWNEGRALGAGGQRRVQARTFDGPLPGGDGLAVVRVFREVLELDGAALHRLVERRECELRYRWREDGGGERVAPHTLVAVGDRHGDGTIAVVSGGVDVAEIEGLCALIESQLLRTGAIAIVDNRGPGVAFVRVGEVAGPAERVPRLDRGVDADVHGRRSVGLKLDGRGDLEVGCHGVALGEEQVEVVVAPHREAEGVQVHASGHCRVDAPEVNHQVVIDEYPQVVVAGEGEGLAALVREDRVDLVGEVVVVRPALVAEELTVDREERVGVVGVDAAPRRRLSQSDRVAAGHVDGRNIPVPLIESLLAVSRRIAGPTGIDRFLVRPEGSLHDARVDPDYALEIRVRIVEISDGAGQVDRLHVDRGAGTRRTRRQHSQRGDSEQARESYAPWRHPTSQCPQHLAAPTVLGSPGSTIDRQALCVSHVVRVRPPTAFPAGRRTLSSLFFCERRDDYHHAGGDTAPVSHQASGAVLGPETRGRRNTDHYPPSSHVFGALNHRWFGSIAHNRATVAYQKAHPGHQLAGRTDCALSTTTGLRRTCRASPG